GEIQTAAQRLFAQIPDDNSTKRCRMGHAAAPNSPYHIFNVVDAFLEHEVEGLPLTEAAYSRELPPNMNTKTKILAYGRDVLWAVRGLVGWPRPNERVCAQGQCLLRRRDAARVPGTDHLAFGSTCAPARDCARYVWNSAG